MDRDELAKELLVEDRFSVGNAVQTLMRWPKRTLEKHGIIRYDRTNRRFELLVEFESDEYRDNVVSVCTSAISTWRQKEGKKVSSRFYAVVESAGGRCQACGILGSIRPIDVDHIIPRSRARNGRVTLADGTRVAVDDVRNLQALCERCNRGKRDSSTFDFRPSESRIIETLQLVLERGAELGYERSVLLRRASVIGGGGP